MLNTIAMLVRARKKGRYVPAFNIYNLETIQAALESSCRAESPVILAFGERYLSYASFEVIARMAECLSREHPYPVALHLDHCRSLENMYKALKAGFTSAMYDGSNLPFSENIEQTVQARKIADSFGASLEGELGGMNDESGEGENGLFTEPMQAKKFVQETQVDSLAVAVGNAHGLYREKPHIEFQRLKEIYELTHIPLVLHGSSGLSMETLNLAAQIAVAKINVNTEIAMAGAAALRQALQKETKMENALQWARESLVNVMMHFY